MKTKEDVRAFTIYLTPADHRRLKLQAVEEERPMIAIIRDSLRTYLDVFEPRKSNGKR